jgi:hypothetical protein
MSIAVGGSQTLQKAKFWTKFDVRRVLMTMQCLYLGPRGSTKEVRGGGNPARSFQAGQEELSEGV